MSSLPYEAHLYTPVVDIADAGGALRKECCNSERHCSIWDVIAVVIYALELTPLRTCMPCAQRQRNTWRTPHMQRWLPVLTLQRHHGELASPAMVMSQEPTKAALTALFLRRPAKPRLRERLVAGQALTSS